MGTSLAPSLPEPSANTQPFPLNGLEQHSQMRYVLFPKSQEATKGCNLSSMERGSRCNNCPSCKYILTRLITRRCKIPEAACPWISVGFPPDHWHTCVSPKCLREAAAPIPRGRQCSGFEWGPVDGLEITVPEPWSLAEGWRGGDRPATGQQKKGNVPLLLQPNCFQCSLGRESVSSGGHTGAGHVRAPSTRRVWNSSWRPLV